MNALVTALIYFGTFLAIGLIAKIALARWTARHGADLSDVQAQAGPKRGKRRLFLLGSWRTED
jgi:hypothetical protein